MRINSLFLLCMCWFNIANAQNQIKRNPLLNHSDAPVAYDHVNVFAIRSATSQVIELSDQRLHKLITTGKQGTGPDNILTAYDEMYYEINDLSMKLQLISQTYPSDSVRNAANLALQEMNNYQTTLSLNEPLYQVLKSYLSQSGDKLESNQKKYLGEQIRYFENNGMKLDSSGRRSLQQVKDRLNELGIDFDKNLGTSRDSIVYTEKDLTGLPENIKASWKKSNGNYVVYINTPNATNIYKYATADDTRKKMYDHYNNRAYPANMEVLDSLLWYRNKYAKALGYKSYAANVLADKMAGNPQAVWNFEKDLVHKLQPGVTADLASLRALKHQMHPELPDTIFAWDINYYRNILLDTKYKLNTDEIREYFEMNQTISGIFEVYHRLFGITVKETHGWPVWYTKVRTFEIYIGLKKIGMFYFDLYPRQNKYTHFACFPMSQAHDGNGKEVLPAAALICNFPEAAAGQPTLLSHNDVITFFHEFGHLVAFMVVRSDLSTQTTTLKGDFVEAPSQFLENFCWRYEALSVFAKNYKTGKVLPRSLFDKMKETELVMASVDVTRQLFLGMIDFTFEDKYDSIQGMNLNDVVRQLYTVNQIPYPDGTHMITSFTHLNSYGANYYGYMWSRVFAVDIFSVFEKNGIMDSKTGERYRKDILEQAGKTEEMDLLRHFLGREPNANAFMKSIGL